MATTTAFCTQFKEDALDGTVNNSVDTHRIALIKSAPAGTYGAASTSYTDITGNTDEVVGTGYTATGPVLATYASDQGSGEAWIDWTTDPQWTSSSFTASACMIYNDTHASDRALSTHDFGGDQTVTSGTFTIQFPAAAATTALIRIA